MGQHGYQRNYQFFVDFQVVRVKGFVFTAKEAVECIDNTLTEICKTFNISKPAMRELIKAKIKHACLTGMKVLKEEDDEEEKEEEEKSG